MSKYGSDDVTIQVDDSGGSLVDLSNYIDTINDLAISADTQETHAFGDSWLEHLATGLKRMDDVTLEGFYDDTASTGPHVVLNGDGAALGATRTLKVTIGGGKYVQCETIITKYTRKPNRGELTRFTAVLRPTGAVTEA